MDKAYTALDLIQDEIESTKKDIFRIERNLNDEKDYAEIAIQKAYLHGLERAEVLIITKQTQNEQMSALNTAQSPF